MRDGTLVLDRLAETRPLTAPLAYPDGGGELLEVLRRAAEEPHFIAALTERPDEALAGYYLTAEERAALLSGDIAWIEGRVGRLDAHLRTWLECRLQQEAW